MGVKARGGPASMERLPNLHPGSPGFRATAPAGATASEANKLAIALENKLAIARSYRL